MSAGSSFPKRAVAEIHRGYVDPVQPLFRYNGEPAIGLAIAMRKGGNILQFGEALKAKMRAVTATLPIGVGIHLVSDQPRVVEEAVGGFTEALFEAIAIEPTRVYRPEDALSFLKDKGLDLEKIGPQVDGKFMSAFVRAVKPQAAAAAPCCAPTCCSGV